MSNAKKLTVRDVLDFLSGAPKEDRSIINKHILFLSNSENQIAKTDFKYGDKVSFEPKKRHHPRVITGTVVKRNTKMIVVKPDNGGPMWRVQPVMLKKIA
jgi:hypothetical protein